MSRAYKCDRCGALYESYEGENRYDVLKPTKLIRNTDFRAAESSWRRRREHGSAGP